MLYIPGGSCTTWSRSELVKKTIVQALGFAKYLHLWARCPTYEIICLPRSYGDQSSCGSDPEIRKRSAMHDTISNAESWPTLVEVMDNEQDQIPDNALWIWMWAIYMADIQRIDAVCDAVRMVPTKNPRHSLALLCQKCRYPHWCSQLFFGGKAVHANDIRKSWNDDTVAFHQIGLQRNAKSR